MTQGSLHIQKTTRLCTLINLVKGGLFILLYTSMFAVSPVRTAENTTQSRNPRSSPVKQSSTIAARKKPSRTDTPCSVPTDRYPHLFLSLESIQTLANVSKLVDVFKIGAITGQVEISETNNTLLDPITTINANSSEHSSCCTTNLSFAIMSTVVSVYTETAYRVKHHNYSYQPVTVGECAQLGVPCSGGGTCQIATRVQWILVDTGNGSDSFVPVNVPNHCYCQYS